MNLKDIKKLTPTQQECLKQWINETNRNAIKKGSKNEHLQAK